MHPILHVCCSGSGINICNISTAACVCQPTVSSCQHRHSDASQLLSDVLLGGSCKPMVRRYAAPARMQRDY